MEALEVKLTATEQDLEQTDNTLINSFLNYCYASFSDARR
jgi:hypothetical protein